MITYLLSNKSEIISYICRSFWQEIGCRNGSITRKTILNRKNQEKNAVQISENPKLTVRTVVGVRFRYRKF